MTVKYSMYYNIDRTHVELFDTLWDKYHLMLLPIPDDLHNEKDQKAAVFNAWIQYRNIKNYLILKSDRIFTHSFLDMMYTTMKDHMQQNIVTVLEEMKDDEEFMFLFPYHLTRFLAIEMVDFLNEHEELKPLIVKDYYYLSDDELEMDDQLFIVLKVYISQFIPQKIKPENCKHLYINAIKHAQRDWYLILKNGVRM